LGDRYPVTFARKFNKGGGRGGEGGEKNIWPEVIPDFLVAVLIPEILFFIIFRRKKALKTFCFAKEKQDNTIRRKTSETQAAVHRSLHSTGRTI
jgi:hypothetical protein